LKDAVNEAFRDWVTNLSNTYYLVGSCIGPHPFPTIVRDYQKVIGEEIKQQLQNVRGKLPDAVVACVGGGSNAIGTFYDFIPDKSVRLIGVEAGGEGAQKYIYLNVSSDGLVQARMVIATVLHFQWVNRVSYTASEHTSCSLLQARSLKRTPLVLAWTIRELDPNTRGSRTPGGRSIPSRQTNRLFAVSDS
jgi:hypothetical protein